MITDKNVKYIIEAIRDDVENRDVSESIGIADPAFLRHLNDAQQRIYGLIMNKYPSIFTKEVDIPLDPRNPVVPIPIDAMLGNKIIDVKFSDNSQFNWFSRVHPTTIKDFRGGPGGSPRRYYRDNGKLILIPTPSSASMFIRLNYAYKIPQLDLQRGVVGNVVITDQNVITSLQLDVANHEVDKTSLDRVKKFTVVDSDGIVKAANLRYYNLNASTGIIDFVDPSSGRPNTFQLKPGESIEPGDIICMGPYSSTHTMLDEYVERYLIAYTSFKILQREGSVEVNTQYSVLTQMEAEIVDTYSDISDDIMEIPNILSNEDDWV